MNWPVLEALGLRVLWAGWVYQVRTGNLFGGNWQVVTTEKQRPDWYWAGIGIQAVAFFSLTIMFVWNRLLH